MEAKVQQTDEVASQIHGFFNEGVLENDANGKVKVAESFIQRGVEMSQQRLQEMSVPVNHPPDRDRRKA